MSDAQKQAAGEAAMAYVKAGMKVGLGTGSTAAWFVKALATSGLKLTLVSTSTQTTQLAESLGLVIRDVNDVGQLDVVVDGADEIGEGLALIKGGGRCAAARKADLGTGEDLRRHRRFRQARHNTRQVFPANRSRTVRLEGHGQPHL